MKLFKIFTKILYINKINTKVIGIKVKNRQTLKNKITPQFVFMKKSFCTKKFNKI